MQGNDDDIGTPGRLGLIEYRLRQVEKQTAAILDRLDEKDKETGSFWKNTMLGPSLVVIVGMIAQYVAGHFR